MAVVDIKKDGEATLIFHDDYYRDKTQDETEVCLKNIAKITWTHVKASGENEYKG